MTEFLHETVTELWRDQRGPADNLAEAGDNKRSATEYGGDSELNFVAPSKLIPEALNGREISREGIPTWKRVLDLSLVVLTSPVWLPLMIFLMMAVRLSSPGPVFYRQERVGYRRRPFMIYKFRSMKVDAETQVHEAHFERLMRESVPMAKLDGAGDPRILPWGRILRATGLDELPQIFNVIRGEMSLVGPRPCTVPEFSRYATWQQERVNAVPGLTGYWQVNGKNRTTFNEMIEMDIYYSKHMSLSLDLTIMLQTLPALLDQTLESVGGSRNPNRSSFPADSNGREGI